MRVSQHSPGGRLPTNVPRRQRGMSLVELMVGITVGLFVTAAAAMLAAMQMGDNRKMIQEAQVLQDLRATTDMVVRELRRSGARASPHDLVWLPGDEVISTPGNVDDISLNADNSLVNFRYERAGVRQDETGFKLEGGRVKNEVTARVGPTFGTSVVLGWQDLTDHNAVIVTGFSVTPLNVVEEPMPAAPAPQRMPCPKLCPDGTRDCWPTVRIREYRIRISGHSPDNAIERNLDSSVRVRNDELMVPGVGPSPVCPA